jgi:enoyl-[acyl-carrier protein] reductase II
LIKNKFFHTIREAEERGATPEELKEILGHGRAKLGMFEGNLDEGELEIGQASGYINEIKPAGKIIQEIIREFESAKNELANFTW